MKKLVLSLAAIALAAGAYAQNFTVTVGGEAVENGSTVINGDLVEELTQFGMYQVDPQVYVYSDQDCFANIQIELLEGTAAQICAWGSCVPVSKGTPVLKSGEMEAGVGINTQIEGPSGFSKEDAYAKAVISVWSDENEDEDAIFSFTLVMDATYAGVNNMLASNAVNFSNNAINYDLTNGSVEVYTVGGALVKSVKVSGNGSVDLSTLPSALYIYRVKDGKKVASGKAFIK